jgi:hypothetical protein
VDKSFDPLLHAVPETKWTVHPYKSIPRLI